MEDSDPSYRGVVIALTVIVFFCSLTICAEAFSK